MRNQPKWRNRNKSVWRKEIERYGVRLEGAATATIETSNKSIHKIFHKEKEKTKNNIPWSYFYIYFQLSFFSTLSFLSCILKLLLIPKFILYRELIIFERNRTIVLYNRKNLISLSVWPRKLCQLINGKMTHRLNCWLCQLI